MQTKEAPLIILTPSVALLVRSRDGWLIYAPEHSPVTTITEEECGRAFVRASQLKVCILDLLASTYWTRLVDSWPRLNVLGIDLLVPFESVPERRWVVRRFRLSDAGSRPHVWYNGQWYSPPGLGIYTNTYQDFHGHSNHTLGYSCGSPLTWAGCSRSPRKKPPTHRPLAAAPDPLCLSYTLRGIWEPPPYQDLETSLAHFLRGSLSVHMPCFPQTWQSSRSPGIGLLS